MRMRYCDEDDDDDDVFDLALDVLPPLPLLLLR